MNTKYENHENPRPLGSRFISNVLDLKFRDGSRPYYRDPKTGAVRSVRRDAIRARRKELAKASNQNAPVRVLLDESELYEKAAG